MCSSLNLMSLRNKKTDLTYWEVRIPSGLSIFRCLRAQAQPLKESWKLNFQQVSSRKNCSVVSWLWCIHSPSNLQPLKEPVWSTITTTIFLIDQSTVLLLLSIKPKWSMEVTLSLSTGYSTLRAASETSGRWTATIYSIVWMKRNRGRLKTKDIVMETTLMFRSDFIIILIIKTQNSVLLLLIILRLQLFSFIF